MIETIDKYGIELFYGSDSCYVDHVALLLTNAYVWVPMFIAMLVLIIKNHDNMQQILLCIGCIALCVFIASGMANLVVKPMVERLRPCNDPQYKYLEQIAGNLHEKDFSFFSAHAANTMAVATFFTLLVRSALLSCTLYVWSFVNIWSRLYLGQHFLTDVLVGLLWGIVSGIIAYMIFFRIHNRISTSKRYVSSQYTSTGFSLLDIDVVVSLFCIVIVCSMIPFDDIVYNMLNLIR